VAPLRAAIWSTNVVFPTAEGPITATTRVRSRELIKLVAMSGANRRSGLSWRISAMPSLTAIPAICQVAGEPMARVCSRRLSP
jgi:hypothetical protein